MARDFSPKQFGQLVGNRVRLPGHFDGEVTVEAVRLLAGGVEVRVRLANGELDEAVLSADDLTGILERRPDSEKDLRPVDAEKLRLLVESARIRLAYAYDRQFAVSLSGIRTLPHQIEAVYLKMLPQPRLRFLLADDPGAGKTIMAGLLIKEMKLREALERCLILVPPPLTIQWQDELLRFFGESFQIINAGNDQQQLLNLWQRESQVITSLDYAKQEDVRERVWQQRWDLVVIDEAHKCSAYTKRSSGRGDEVDKTRRYQLAERLVAMTDHLLMLTATPHHGDDDRFGHFVRLLDPDLFPEPHKLGEAAAQIRRDILKLGPESPWALRRLKEDLKDLNGKRLFPDRFAHTVTFRLSRDEFDLYKAVTAYINEFLPQATGKKKNSVALARTVFQRRLASSTNAIYESLLRRSKKLQDLLRELEGLSPSQRARRLAQMQGRAPDAEQDEDDLDDEARDQLVDETTAALEIAFLFLFSVATSLRAYFRTRTPQVGCTMRSLSHNLALLPSDGVFATTWFPLPSGAERLPSQSEEPFNLLIIPFPYSTGGSCFLEGERPASGDPRFFECKQRWLPSNSIRTKTNTIGRVIKRLIKTAKKGVGRVHGVVLPEAALSTLQAIDLINELKSADLELLITGILDAPKKKEEFSRNVAWAVPFWKGKVPFIAVQPKHHRWKLDKDQIIRYSLGHVLDPERDYWEAIDVRRREGLFFVFRHGASLTSVVCEDLARVDPVGDIIRSIGPNLVVALLMDGPQLEARWPGKCAAVLADDPGSAVLTVTSLGMIKRSMDPGHQAQPVVALWKEPGGRAKELSLPVGAHALLLTLSFSEEEQLTFDGRSDGGGTTRIRLSGLRPVVDAISSHLLDETV